MFSVAPRHGATFADCRFGVGVAKRSRTWWVMARQPARADLRLQASQRASVGAGGPECACPAAAAGRLRLADRRVGLASLSKKKMQYRLDQDVALVLASAVDINPDTQEKTFTVEKIEKVQHWEAVKISLDQEWQTVLLNRMKTDTEEYSSPQKAEYWDRDVKRLKRMSSEPTR